MWLLLVGCGPPETGESARSPITTHLERQYGGTFELTSVERRPHGLAGGEAHFFTYRAEDFVGRAFEGSADFDTEPPTFVDHYPCARDEHASDAALDAALEIDKSRVLQRSVACSPTLAEAQPSQLGAGLSWQVSLAVFDRASLADTHPIHERIQKAAEAAGVPHVDVRIHAYSTGWTTVSAFPDAPLSPTIETVSLGTSRSQPGEEIALQPVARSTDVANSIRNQLPEPPGVLWVTVEAKPGSPVAKKLENTPLAELSEEEQRDLRVTLLLAVEGGVPQHGEAVRAWVEAVYQAVPTALTPAIYIAFFEPGRRTGWAPERQSTVWVANRGMGHRIRKSGMGSSKLIEAFKYIVLPEGVP